MQREQSLRIGMMVDAYKPHVSGVTNHVSLSKASLEAAGHRVFVFTMGDMDYEDDELHVIRSPGLPLSDTGYSLNFGYSTVARRKLQTMDVVHVHHPFLSGRLALRYCKPRGIPIVFTNHTRYDLYAHAYLPFMPDQLSLTLLQAYMPRFCAACDLVIAPSPGMARVLRELGVTSPVEVVPNGVQLAPLFQPPGTSTRAELGLPAEGLVLIYAGRLAPEKNLAFLLRAFGGALAACPDLTRVLAGGGPEGDKLQDQARRAAISERVVFLGMVPYDRLPGVLCLADLFVTASITEAHPLSLIEAMAAGLPAVGIESPGVGDIIQDGFNGVLCSNDLAAFTARLVRLVLDEPARRRLAANARETSRQYAIERTTDLVLAHYREVVARGSSTRRGLAGLPDRLQSYFR